MSSPNGSADSLSSSRRQVMKSLRIDKISRLFNSQYTLAVGAQALVSGFHFILNLALLRLISQYDYGVFAFAFVLGMFAQAINNALISTPLTVYTPVLKDASERQRQEWMLGSANLLFFIGLVLSGLMFGMFSSVALSTSLGVTCFVAVYAARHFSRSFGYARMRPLVTAMGDVCYVVVGAALVTVLVTQYSDVTVGVLLAALSLANLFAMALERALLHGKSAFRFAWQFLSDYHVIWEQSRWALAGALTTLFMSQAHSLIVTGMHSPTAFAPLAAGFVLFGPVRVALMTWQNMVKPEFAIDIAENRLKQVNKRVLRTAALMGIAVLVLSLIMYLFWPVIHGFLYQKKYAEEPMGMIVGTWAVITFFAAVYNAPSAALQAMRDFKILAYASIYGSIISAIAVTLALIYYQPETTLFGILLAEMFTAVFLINVMNKKIREGQ